MRIREAHTGCPAQPVVIRLAYRRSLPFPFVLGVFASLLCALAHCAIADTDTRPIVVLREDDCNRQWTTPYVGLGGLSGIQYGKSKHIPITWGVITDWATRGQSLTWTEIKDYLDTAGGEAASHSCSHVALPSAAAYVAELTASKQAIEANLPGYQCTSFYQPGLWGTTPDTADTIHAYLDTFAELDNPIGQGIQSTYSQSMASLGGGWQVGPSYYRYGYGYSYSVDAPQNPSIAGLEARLNAVAATPGTVCVISCHGILEQGVQNNGYTVPADVMRALMDKLALLRDQGKIRLMSLHDAMHTPLPDNLNRVPDSGFELADSSTPPPHSAWLALGGAAFVPNSGVDGSRCGYVDQQPSSSLQTAQLLVGPGRYRLSWYQKPSSGTSPTRSTRLSVLSMYPDITPPVWKAINAAFNPRFTNTSSTEWERKTVLLKISYGMPMLQVQFYADGAFLIDNVSLVSEPIDPGTSPSDIALSPAPTHCVVTWTTPPDASVTRIVARYGRDTFPQTPAEGNDLGALPAVPGTRQQLTAPISWTPVYYLYCSVFAVHPDGSYSPPETAALTVSRTVPTPAVSAALSPAGSIIKTSWTSSNIGGLTYGYCYGLGSTPSSPDILPWVATTSNQADIELSPAAPDIAYVIVKEQNLYGFWSASAAKDVVNRRSISAVLDHPDGMAVSISGLVSAVYADSFYVEQADRTRGIRVWGLAPSPEGTEVVVNGELSTTHGERGVIAYQDVRREP